MKMIKMPKPIFYFALIFLFISALMSYITTQKYIDGLTEKDRLVNEQLKTCQSNTLKGSLIPVFTNLCLQNDTLCGQNHYINCKVTNRGGAIDVFKCEEVK